MTKEELAKRVAELSAPACATDPTETCRCSGNALRIVADQRDRALALLRDDAMRGAGSTVGEAWDRERRALLAEADG